MVCPCLAKANVLAADKDKISEHRYLWAHLILIVILTPAKLGTNKNGQRRKNRTFPLRISHKSVGIYEYAMYSAPLLSKILVACDSFSTDSNGGRPMYLPLTSDWYLCW